MINKISVLTAGKDKPYNLGLLGGLINQGIEVDFIANDEMQFESVVNSPLVNYYNLRGDQSPNASLKSKIYRVFKYYFKLIFYAIRSDSRVFHIQWLNKFEYFDRTILNLFYKFLEKKIVFTAHNIDISKRDGNSSLLNKLSLQFLYKIVDHIIVHTKIMKDELTSEYNINPNKISVISFGINNTVPNTALTKSQAREILGLDESLKILLHFGNIAPYKGIDVLLDSISLIDNKIDNFKLIIAGRIKNSQKYWEYCLKKIETNEIEYKIIKDIRFIPDSEIEIYFKASDVLILPYKFIYQSGPLFLAYNFGLPVIATNVGSFTEDIIVGKTGYICRREDPKDLANTIVNYFNSNLYFDIEVTNNFIINYSVERYSWDNIARKTISVYNNI